MAAVVFCLTKWRHYLHGSKFVVYSDNIALSFFTKQSKLSPKQVRWQEVLSSYDFEIVHKPGKENVVADALSRSRITGKRVRQRQRFQV